MNNRVSEFFKEVSKNEKLRRELSEEEKGLGKNLSKEEVKDFFQQKFLPIAKKYGFDFTYEDIKEYKKSMEPKDGQELGVDLLEGVTGGYSSFYPRDLDSSYCYCHNAGTGNFPLDH